MSQDLRFKKERELVDRMLRGGKGEFEKLYKKEIAGLRRFIQSKIGSVEDVEELGQDTFLAFLDSLPLFGFRSTLKTFLYSIARHEVADYFRRKYAKRALKLVPIIGEFVAEELFTTRELSQRIEEVYRKILPEYAQILRLKYEENMSVKQIARKLKTTVKAAESKLFRARKAFQLAYLEIENDNNKKGSPTTSWLVTSRQERSG